MPSWVQSKEALLERQSEALAIQAFCIGIIGREGDFSRCLESPQDIPTRATAAADIIPVVFRGKVPVIINVAEQTTKAAIEAARKGKEDGARGLMMLPPMRYKADDRETVTYFKAVANSTDLPIMVYNNPVDYGIEVTLDMFEELVECSNIQTRRLLLLMIVVQSVLGTEH